MFSDKDLFIREWYCVLCFWLTPWYSPRYFILGIALIRLQLPSFIRAELQSCELPSRYGSHLWSTLYSLAPLGPLHPQRNMGRSSSSSAIFIPHISFLEGFCFRRRWVGYRRRWVRYVCILSVLFYLSLLGLGACSVVHLVLCRPLPCCMSGSPSTLSPSHVMSRWTMVFLFPSSPLWGVRKMLF